MEKQMAEENKQYENLAAGDYEGRLVYVADLGIQKPFDLKDKPKHKIALGIEILGHTVDVNGEQKPRMLWSRSFNIFNTLTELGTETKMYRIFNPKAKIGQAPDWESALGKPCNVIVGHDVKGSATYDKIVDITPIPSKYQDNVADATITNMAVGDENDPDNPAQRAMYGLTKWQFENTRLSGKTSKAKIAEPDVDDVPLDDAIPF